MLFMLGVPVLFMVAAAHRYLQLYAPSNAVIARVRMTPPRWRVALGVSALAVTLLLATHVLAAVVAAGGPGWLNLVVVVLAWDAIKFGWLAVVVVVEATPHRHSWRTQENRSGADGANTRDRPSALS